MLTEVELAYIAGLFDGEGSVSISHYETGRFYLTASIGMQSEVVNWVAEKCEGVSNPCGSMFQVTFLGGKAKQFLKPLLPYLKVKKPDAEIALEFPTQETNTKIPDSIKLTQALLLVKLRKLRRKIGE